MTRLLALLLSCAALAVIAGPALAAGGQTITPTAKQKASIIRGWAAMGDATKKYPAKCFTIKISRSNRVLAGLAFNSDGGADCITVAFDGTALLWNQGFSWTTLIAGSSIFQSTCSPLKQLIGAKPWQDLAGFISGLGCPVTA